MKHQAHLDHAKGLDYRLVVALGIDEATVRNHTIYRPTKLAI